MNWQQGVAVAVVLLSVIVVVGVAILLLEQLLPRVQLP